MNKQELLDLAVEHIKTWRNGCVFLGMINECKTWDVGQPSEAMLYITKQEWLEAKAKKFELTPCSDSESVFAEEIPRKEKSDGSTADYYELSEGATQLQDLIGFKNMNAQMGEIFRACYRYGQVEHSEKLRDAKKIKFYIEAEIERLIKYGN